MLNLPETSEITKSFHCSVFAPQDSTHIQHYGAMSNVHDLFCFQEKLLALLESGLAEFYCVPEVAEPANHPVSSHEPAGMVETAEGTQPAPKPLSNAGSGTSEPIIATSVSHRHGVGHNTRPCDVMHILNRVCDIWGDAGIGERHTSSPALHLTRLRVTDPSQQ